jgi:hypothetical protein
MNFNGFSPDSFEQFIRAVSLKVFGPGVTLFGNGPDGGREATFHGKVSLPPEDLWDGYGVVQAKFKEKPETTSQDQTWAVRQLEDELSRWIANKRRAPKPDYFVFCTNVDLTSAASGGRSKMENVFAKHQATLQLKGHAIWDANQLSGYVDIFEEIRRRFTCFFTPGDLLAEIAKALTRVPDPDAILAAYLSREILADEDARLSQAGDRSEDRIRLADIFVDLPVAQTFITEPPTEHANDGLLPPASLHDLLRTASCKLDPSALSDQLTADSRLSESPGRIYGRFVFLGGPGSGKSTVGQFLSQIHRAAILDRRDPNRLEWRVKNVIRDIKKRCEQEKAQWPSTPRYPFRIELNAFAKALAAENKDRVATFSAYLRQTLSRDTAISHEDLRDWLRAFPWLLILDGLDEVPSSSNRREVVAAIQDFLNEARDVEADLLLVASSRPDGYAGEFDGEEVAQLFLLPLSKDRSLACAQRYVDAKFAVKGERRAQEAMTIIADALKNPLVEKLMRSPLQVTFMVTVVAASGKPSESRWQLFNDYYRTIYERELHKAVRPFDKVLNERRQDIDALHHRVGFILQCRAESSGGTQADLSLAEFTGLVRSCLEENGLTDKELEQQKEMILGAANQRLVFLTSRTPGRLSFEVRSLQEYMAAACITNGDSVPVIRRLGVIAHSAYWRNTFLFAIGRFFVDPQFRDHRDRIRILCDDLNRSDPARSAAKLGSRLALDILESGIVGNVPSVTRSLAACSLGLLSNPPDDEGTVALRLSQVYEPVMEKEFQEAILIRLGQREVSETLSAWIVLQYLEKRGIGWAAQKAVEKWPADPSSASVVLSAWLGSYARTSRRGYELSSVNIERLARVVQMLSPQQLSSVIEGVRLSAGVKNPAWLRELIHWWNAGDSLDVKFYFDGRRSGLSFGFNAVPRADDANALAGVRSLSEEGEIHPEWKCLASCADFLATPNAKTLAGCLMVFAASVEPSSWRLWARRLPWPVSCCLTTASSKEELIRLSEQAQAGKCGDGVEWEKSQVSWKEMGITIENLCGRLFESDAILGNGATTMTFEDVEADVAHVLAKALLDHLGAAIDPKIASLLAWVLPFYAATSRSLHHLDPRLLSQHLLSTPGRWTASELIVSPDTVSGNETDWIDFLDEVGCSETVVYARTNWRLGEAPVDWTFQKFMSNPAKRGLLRLVGFWCASGRCVSEAVKKPTALGPFADPRFDLAGLLVRLAWRDLDDNEALRLGDELQRVTGNGCDRKWTNILMNAVERHGTDLPALETFLAKLMDILPSDDWEVRGRGERMRSMFLQEKASGLDVALLKGLGLPFLIEP